MPMTFEQFQTTRRLVPDLRAALTFGADYFEEPTPGYAYAGNLHIEIGDGGWLCLTIANTSKLSSDLTELEAELFEYGQREGLVSA
jgi:hypothetical protein